MYTFKRPQYGVMIIRHFTMNRAHPPHDSYPQWVQRKPFAQLAAHQSHL